MTKKILEYFTNSCYSIIRIGKLRVMKMRRRKITIFDVANFFLKIVDRDSGSTITPLKLQKILYYAQGYYLARFDKPLFDDDFQAWAHGPANPAIYDKYKDYRFESIDEPEEELYDFDEDTSLFLAHIWDAFGIYDGKYLEELCTFDIYRSKQLEGKKSIAFRIKLISDEKTLSEEDISKIINKILKRAEENFGAKLR